MTDAITGTSTAADTSKAAASGKSLAQNFDTFLTMLTTQLKHQDPLSPMDSTQFTNQLVQFAGVEQQINANSNLEKLISATSLNTRSQSVNYIGHVIEADTNQVPLQGATDTEGDAIKLNGGTATFKYSLDTAAASAQIKVTDANGNLVRTLVGGVNAGGHEVTWDGKNSAGETVPDGNYKIEVVAKNSAGAAVGAKTYVTTRDSVAAFSYTLAEDVATSSVVIKDSSGAIVRTLPGSPSAGRHEVTWDGKDSNGKVLPDGAYTVSITGLTGSGANVESAITVYGRVTDVSADENDTLLAMGKVVTSISKVLTVRDTASVQTPGTIN